MFNISKNRPTHGARLERWLGKEQVEQMSKGMTNWYGSPIAVSGVPGNVWALPGGDFGGIIKSGQFLNAVDYSLMKLKARFQRMGLRNRQQCGAGFASLSDLIAEATAGKMRHLTLQKTGLGGAINQSNTLWSGIGFPAAGGAASAAPGGRAVDGTTVGAVFGLDDVSPDTRHLVFSVMQASILGNTLMMYDRLFDVAKTMNSTATEAVTGVPTRYQSNTVTDPDFAGGNFVTIEVQTNLSAGAHNWDQCLYRNQAGTDNQIFPALVGTTGNAAGRLDVPLGTWFMPLASGDYGVADLAQIQCSAAIATGAINFVIGHPLAWMPCPIASTACTQDGINTAFNLVRIFDGAAISFLETIKPAATATVYVGSVTFVHG